jgi:hypothetical protein
MLNMPKFKYASFLTVLVLPLLASCSTVMEGSTQQISFQTVGAEDAYCTIQTGESDYAYNVRPPQTIRIHKSRGTMFVSCSAPGNRMQNVTVESKVAGTTYMNGLNGGVGAAVDADSGAMYKYPDTVVIDFTSIMASPSALPSYENADGLNPKDAGIEYLGPDTPKLDEDDVNAQRYKDAYDEDARMQAEKNAYEVEKQRRINSLEGGFYGDKGHDSSVKDPVSLAPVGKQSAVVAPENDESSVAIPKEAVPKTAPAAPVAPTSSNVTIAPLSEAMPAGKAAAPSASTPTVVDDSAVVLPPANHLTKPIFPSSTTF